MNLSNKNGQTAIHFMTVGSSDSILIEANGHYGLVDSGNPYQFIEHEVEHVQIDESIGERNQWDSNSNLERRRANRFR